MTLRIAGISTNSFNVTSAAHVFAAFNVNVVFAKLFSMSQRNENDHVIMMLWPLLQSMPVFIFITFVYVLVFGFSMKAILQPDVLLVGLDWLTVFVRPIEVLFGAVSFDIFNYDIPCYGSNASSQLFVECNTADFQPLRRWVAACVLVAYLFLGNLLFFNMVQAYFNVVYTAVNAKAVLISRCFMLNDIRKYENSCLSFDFDFNSRYFLKSRGISEIETTTFASSSAFIVLQGYYDEFKKNSDCDTEFGSSSKVALDKHENRLVEDMKEFRYLCVCACVRACVS